MGLNCNTSQVPWEKIRGKIAESLPQGMFSALNELMISANVPDLFIASYPYGKLNVERRHSGASWHLGGCYGALDVPRRPDSRSLRTSQGGVTRWSPE